MRVVCQRVTEARVRVGGELRGEIGPGLVAFVGIARGDDSAIVRRLAAKVARLRIFEGNDGRFDSPVAAGGGGRSAIVATAMRVICQRVTEARVRVGDDVVGEIGTGLVALVGIARADDAAIVRRMAAKVARLRIFEGDDGRFDRSVLESGGSVLSVSQFTLIADTSKGNRPSFTAAAPPEEAEPRWEEFSAELEAEGVSVARGVFGARMDVELVNAGPVTIVLDS